MLSVCSLLQHPLMKISLEQFTMHSLILSLILRTRTPKEIGVFLNHRGTKRPKDLVTNATQPQEQRGFSAYFIQQQRHSSNTFAKWDFTSHFLETQQFFILLTEFSHCCSNFQLLHSHHSLLKKLKLDVGLKISLSDSELQSMGFLCNYNFSISATCYGQKTTRKLLFKVCKYTHTHEFMCIYVVWLF